MLTAEQRIEKAHVRIMHHEATMAYASLIMVGDTHVSDEVPTAYTNGKDKTYGRAFVTSLTDPELVGLILHEAGHIMYQHAYVWKHLWKKNAQLANQAADYVINIEIHDLSRSYPDFIALPEGGLLDLAYRGMNTQEVFEILSKQDDGGKSAKGFDTHDFEEMTEEQGEMLSKEVEAALNEGGYLAGKKGKGAPKSFKELTAPKVNWREQLMAFATETAKGSDDVSWRRLNRRWMSIDVLMPSSESVTVPRISVVCDSSGSVDERLVSSFMSEVVGICRLLRPNIVDLICCDDVVRSHDIYDETSYGQLEQVRSIKGGGGTDMRVALDFIDKQGLNPNVVIVLTDGYTPYPTELKRPTLWGITTKRKTAPVGVTIHVI